jgi:hypothetical protein
MAQLHHHEIMVLVHHHLHHGACGILFCIHTSSSLTVSSHNDRKSEWESGSHKELLAVAVLPRGSHDPAPRQSATLRPASVCVVLADSHVGSPCMLRMAL